MLDCIPDCLTFLRFILSGNVYLHQQCIGSGNYVRNDHFRKTVNRGTWISLILFMTAGFVVNHSYAQPKPARPSATIASIRDSLSILDTVLKNNGYIYRPPVIKAARDILRISFKLDDEKRIINAYLNLGNIYMDQAPDTALGFLQAADSCMQSSGIFDRKPALLYALAESHSVAFNYETALVLLDSCVKLSLEVSDFRKVSDSYNLLGLTYLSILDGDMAKIMFDSARTIAQRHNEKHEWAISLANIAKITDDKNEKIRLQRQAIQLLKENNTSEYDIGSIYHNLGLQFDNLDSASHYFNLAIRIGEKKNFPTLLIASYNSMAYVWLEKGNYGKAEECLRDHAIPIARKINELDWISELYDSYADVLSAGGRYKEALEMQKKALRERTSADEQIASKQVRTLSKLLELKNKDLEIKNCRNEIAIQKNRLFQTRLWGLIVILMCVVAFFAVLLLLQRVRHKLKRQQLESARHLIELEESEKGRTAMELHDITGQLFLGVIREIEDHYKGDPSSSERIKLIIKDLWDRIRKISHRMSSNMLENLPFNDAIRGLCSDFEKSGKLKIICNFGEGINHVSREIELHTYRMVQEMLSNTHKHTPGGNVYLTILIKGSNLSVYFNDPGPGFDDSGHHGMGLMNIYQRTQLLKGKATLTTSREKNTAWEITIPLKQAT